MEKYLCSCGASVLLIGNKQQAINIIINNIPGKKVMRAMGNKEKLERNWKCCVWASESRLQY